MPYDKGRHPGAVWLKSDLQCHTPRDRSWRGTPTGLPGGNKQHEEARTRWAEHFITACKDKALRVVAITDHHDFRLSEYVTASADAHEDFSVFRGIEVTCSDNVQCLVLFDPACERTILAKFLSGLKGIIPAGDHEAFAAETQPCHLGLEQLFEAVQADPQLKDLCILLPHFSNESAHKSANAKGFHMRFAGLECDAVYIELPFNELDPGTISKIRGEVPKWGTRRRGVIATGDNKADNWARLGYHDCWVKLGEHSIEGLRQAFLADEARISFTDPTEPAERILELTVQSTLTDGRPLSLVFNAGFNALIGGRGSGKSSMIEYLRFGLARTATDLRLLDGSVSRERDEKLIEDTLKGGGFVRLAIERHGLREVWHRALETRDHITVTDNNGNDLSLSLDDARRRFRARAFEQKGLSSTMNDRTKAADQITGIAAAEELEQRREIDDDIAKSKRAVTTALRQAAALWQLQREEARATAAIVDLKQQLAVNGERLQKQGVGPEALAILDRVPAFSYATTFLRQIEEETKSALDKLGKLETELATERYTTPPEGFLHLDELRELSASERLQASHALLVAREHLVRLNVGVARTAQKHAHIAAEFNEQHQAAVQQQSMHRMAIEENQRLTTALAVAVEEERLAKFAVEGQLACAEKLTDARIALQANVERRREILRAAANKVAGYSGNTLQARHKNDPKCEDYRNALEQVCTGSYMQDASERCRARSEGLTTENWNTLCLSLIEIYKEKIMLGSAPEPSEAQAEKLGTALFGNNANLTSRITKRLFGALDDRMVGDFLAATPRDFIVLTYVDEGDRKIPFERASPGQQASALLELLLSQSAGTLIIDQPEDDLDNKVVMKIVDLIKLSKSRRQLIFATHNPNVVVNGDADKIVSLTTGEKDPRPGRDDVCIAVEEDGAIETPAVKQAITRIMEGGKSAFEMRRRKYRFEHHM